MIKGIGGLIFLVIFIGRSLRWIIFPYPYVIILPLFIKILTLLMVILGAWIGYELSKFFIRYDRLSLKNYGLSWFLSNIWNMPVISTLGINYYPIIGGSFLYKSLDQGWSEVLGSQGIYSVIVRGSKISQIFMNNSIKIFFVLMIVWLIIIFIIYLNSL